MATETKSTVNFTTARNGLKSFMVELYPTVKSGDWVSWPESERTELRSLIERLQFVTSELRPAFDNTVWNTPSIPDSVSIRAKADFKTKPGRKAVVKTAAELFDGK